MAGRRAPDPLRIGDRAQGTLSLGVNVITFDQPGTLQRFVRGILAHHDPAVWRGRKPEVANLNGTLGAFAGRTARKAVREGPVQVHSRLQPVLMIRKWRRVDSRGEMRDGAVAIALAVEPWQALVICQRANDAPGVAQPNCVRLDGNEQVRHDAVSPRFARCRSFRRGFEHLQGEVVRAGRAEGGSERFDLNHPCIGWRLGGTERDLGSVFGETRRVIRIEPEVHRLGMRMHLDGSDRTGEEHQERVFCQVLEPQHVKALPLVACVEAVHHEVRPAFHRHRAEQDSGPSRQRRQCVA